MMMCMPLVALLGHRIALPRELVAGGSVAMRERREEKEAIVPWACSTMSQAEIGVSELSPPWTSLWSTVH